MARVFVPQLSPGLLRLDPAAVHHLRDVLRLGEGVKLELFDAAGHEATARIRQSDRAGLTIEVGPVSDPPALRPLTVASALPKGERADWLVEKLSEVGTGRFIPLRTARSVVEPQGTAKFERWRRLAIESARQCRRVGVMEVAELSDFAALLKGPEATLVCSLRPSARPILEIDLSTAPACTLLIGPEGDFSDEEYDQAVAAGAIEVALTPTVLRVETAAVVAASLVAMKLHSPLPPR